MKTLTVLFLLLTPILCNADGCSTVFVNGVACSSCTFMGVTTIMCPAGK